jgi:hypothetical protein
VPASGPATRPPFSLFELYAYSLDPAAPGLGLFCIFHPANPLIARKRRYGFPKSERISIGKKSFSQINRNAMHNARSNFRIGHAETFKIRL